LVEGFSKRLRPRCHGKPSVIETHQKDLPLNEPLPGAGSSLWLFSIPSVALGTVLSRREFLALLRLRYHLMPTGTSAHCACGATNDLIHPTICPKGGLAIRSHNQVRDWLAKALAQLAPASTEPHLQPVSPLDSFRYRSTTRDPEARSDVLSLVGFFGPWHWTHIDVCIFARLQKDLSTSSLFQALRTQELDKGRKYHERIQTVKKADFVPFIVSDSGLLGRQARTFLAQLSDRLSVKLGQKLATVRSCMMAELSFICQRRLLDCFYAPRGTKDIPPGSFLSLSAPSAAGLDRNTS